MSSCCCSSCASCSHDHEEEKDNLSLFIIRIIASIILFALTFVYKDYSLVLFIISYIIAGYDVIIDSFKSIIKFKPFSETLLMTIATIGAFCIGEFAEALAVMIFYKIGEFFQDMALQKSMNSINSLLDLHPDKAHLKSEDGIITVAPGDVKVGDTIVVNPGERVPLDGILISKSAVLDTSALTGESMYYDALQDEEILSGSINLKNIIEIKTIRPLEESATERIFNIVTGAREKKAKSENFIAHFAKYYTMVVVFLAIFIAFVPPIFFDNLQVWIYRALIFLVASCPCALVLSIPLSFFAGIGLGSKNGILFKGSNYIEKLAKINTVAFDKTGTLTKGELAVTEVIALNGYSRDDVLRLCAHCEYNSDHPIGKAIVKEYGNNIDPNIISEFNELVGGVSATVSSSKVLCGKASLFSIENSEYDSTHIYVQENGTMCGVILLSDTIKETSKEAIQKLKSLGLNISMLTGDNKNVAASVADELSIYEHYSSLLPEDKLNIIKRYTDGVAFVGDGINDAPALCQADIGIAMGGIGRDAAIESADVVIMTDDLLKVSDSISISKKTMHVVTFNITMSISIKLAVLILSVFGITNMWAAVFADVGVALIAIFIAARLFFSKKALLSN